MKYEIIYKDDVDSKTIKKVESQIKSIIKNEKFNDKIKSLDFNKLIFSIGGDGTFLDAVNKFGYDNLFIPINKGTLGFYTSWNTENIENIIKEKTNIINAPLLKINLNDKVLYSVNEATIINPINTQILEISINGEHFENFRGTGICISTPTGSTGYNKSLGGALIDPKKELFQLVKIAPINNIKYRNIENSIILSQDDKVTISSTKENFIHSTLTIDRNHFNLKENVIDFSLSNKKLKILTNDISFYSRVKKNFLLGDTIEKK